MDILGKHGAVPTERARRRAPRPRIITAAGVSSGIDMALRLVELLVDQTAAEACQLMIEYDPQPPFDAGAVAKAGDDVIDPRHRVRRRSAELAQRVCAPDESAGDSCGDTERRGQTAVAQIVSPRALLAGGGDGDVVAVAVERAEHPSTMPRSTAQITGWSVATAPNGQWSLMIRSPVRRRRSPTPCGRRSRGR